MKVRYFSVDTYLNLYVKLTLNNVYLLKNLMVWAVLPKMTNIYLRNQKYSYLRDSIAATRVDHLNRYIPEQGRAILIILSPVESEDSFKAKWKFIFVILLTRRYPK